MDAAYIHTDRYFLGITYICHARPCRKIAAPEKTSAPGGSGLPPTRRPRWPTHPPGAPETAKAVQIQNFARNATCELMQHSHDGF